MAADGKKLDESCLILFVMVFGMFLGALIGTQGEKKNWERMLVDSPDTVSAIRSRVLAEREGAK